MTIKYCDDTENQQNGSMPPDMATERGRRHKQHFRKFWGIYVIIAVVVLIIAGFVIVPLIGEKAPHTALIKLPAGANEQTLEDTIKKYMGASYAKSVRQALPIATGGEPLARGAWEIEQGTTAVAAARKIAKGAQTGIRVTIVNERTPQDLAAKFASKLDVPADSLLAALNNKRLQDRYHSDAEHIFGEFFADTYEFYWTATPRQIIEKMHRNYRRFWTNERLKKAEQLHLLPREIVVIASIVDEETNLESEKGTIGRLYANRLLQGMKLQADPTVKYAIGDFSIKRITGDMLKTDSPYNTYLHEGLPPGPIRITSAATIDAILNSQPHGYLYMCAAEDFSGHHNFAVDYETHMANARRYQQALNQRGIK